MKRFAPFKGNVFPTVGVEQEFHLVNPDSGDLEDAFSDVYHALPARVHPFVTAELKDCLIEGQTPPCRTISELQNHVSERRLQLAEACKTAGVRLVAAGTHPFAQWARHPYVDDEHYRWVKQETGYISDRMLGFGLHVHVGMKSMESALYVLHEFRRWIYPLLAMSANSPFFEGYNTHLDSIRMHLFGSMPRTGLPPDVLDIAEYEYIYNRLLLAGDVTAPGDLWWIVRPQPPLGTLEIRVFDLPTDWRRVGALAAVSQCTLAYYQDRFEAGHPPAQFQPAFFEQNRWKAMRYGLDADIVEAETGDVIDVRKHLAHLLKMIEPKAEELNCTEYVDAAADILKSGNEATAQRKLFTENGGDLQKLELQLADRTLPTV